LDDFIKYVNPGSDDKNWGLYLNCAGKAWIRPGTLYPPPEHPTGYFFAFDKGRILQEYQVNYITEGGGIYENHSGRFTVKSGSLLITRPGDWHRYHPRKKTGWVEHYVGFTGRIADDLFSNTWISQKKAVIDIGIREEILDTYYKIFELVKQEKPGYQQVAAGMVMKLLGYVVYLDKQKDFSGKRIEQIIQKACFLIRENVEDKMDFKVFAEEHNIGYSYFRQKFKLYTGVPPVQYHLDLKILKAKEMLLSTDKRVKEISYDLGFQSVYYFSRLFKMKLGISPSQLRETVKN